MTDPQSQIRAGEAVMERESTCRFPCSSTLDKLQEMSFPGFWAKPVEVTADAGLFAEAGQFEFVLLLLS